MAEQVRHRWARAVLLMVTVLGLVGMHGLPDAMASSGGVAIMPTAAAMAPSLAAPMTEPSPARHGRHADPAARRPAQLARAASRFAGTSLAALAGCGMDHSNCVAVLRDAGHQPPASSIDGAVLAHNPPRPMPVSRSARGSRAPPDVSLIALGISRT